MSGLTLYYVFTFTRARKVRRPRTFEEAIIIINRNGFSDENIVASNIAGEPVCLQCFWLLIKARATSRKFSRKTHRELEQTIKF